MEKENLPVHLCTPFELSSAPRTFTKVMKPLVAAYLRSVVIRLLIYLDNIFILAQSREELLSGDQYSLGSTEKLRFLII